MFACFIHFVPTVRLGSSRFEVRRFVYCFQFAWFRSALLVAMGRRRSFSLLVRTIVIAIILTFVVQLGVRFSSVFWKPNEVILQVVVAMAAAAMMVVALIGS